MSVLALPRILGPNVQVKLTTGGGDVSVSLYTEASIEEMPTTKEANVAGSGDDESVFTKRKAKLTLKGLRGLNNCYEDLPKSQQRITGITFTLVDEDGEEIEGDDLPDLIYDATTNPDGFRNWAVTNKKGSQKEEAGDFELEITSGMLNARA